MNDEIHRGGELASPCTVIESSYVVGVIEA